MVITVTNIHEPLPRTKYSTQSADGCPDSHSTQQALLCPPPYCEG